MLDLFCFDIFSDKGSKVIVCGYCFVVFVVEFVYVVRGDSGFLERKDGGFV